MKVHQTQKTMPEETFEYESTEALLAQILAQLKESKPSVKLGFGPSPKARYIYANRQYPDCLWYFWDGGTKEYEAISDNAITGTVTKVEIETKEYKGKPAVKLNITLQADRAYVIQAGFDTLFGKGLLYMLSELPIASLRGPIMIGVEAGETEQVLFCRIYNPVTGKAFFRPAPDDADYAAVAAKVIAKLGESHL
jgi:hypothetical protein